MANKYRFTTVGGRTEIIDIDKIVRAEAPRKPSWFDEGTVEAQADWCNKFRRFTFWFGNRAMTIFGRPGAEVFKLWEAA